MTHTYMHTHTHTHTGVESYHIDRAERIRSDNSIDHRNTDGTTQVHSLLYSSTPSNISSSFVVYTDVFIALYAIQLCSAPLYCAVTFRRCDSYYDYS